MPVYLKIWGYPCECTHPPIYQGQKNIHKHLLEILFSKKLVCFLISAKSRVPKWLPMVVSMLMSTAKHLCQSVTHVSKTRAMLSSEIRALLLPMGHWSPEGTSEVGCQRQPQDTGGTVLTEYPLCSVLEKVLIPPPKGYMC